MSFYNSRWVRSTRKPRLCRWCGERIAAGSVAHYSAGIRNDSGELWSGYNHPECAAAVANTDNDGEDFEEHAHARGRCDDERKLPPEFSRDYRG